MVVLHSVVKNAKSEVKNAKSTSRINPYDGTNQQLTRIPSDYGPVGVGNGGRNSSLLHRHKYPTAASPLVLYPDVYKKFIRLGTRLHHPFDSLGSTVVR